MLKSYSIEWYDSFCSVLIVNGWFFSGILANAIVILNKYNDYKKGFFL